MSSGYTSMISIAARPTSDRFTDDAPPLRPFIFDQGGGDIYIICAPGHYAVQSNGRIVPTASSSRYASVLARQGGRR